MKSPKAPPPPPPDNSAAEEQARLDAERTAIAESKAAGRRSTLVAGGLIAEDEQAGRGLLSQKKRSAARDMGLVG
jgi:hypothetical protein